MPFTGQGTKITNADDVFFSSLSNGQRIQFNSIVQLKSGITLPEAAAPLRVGICRVLQATLRVWPVCRGDRDSSRGNAAGTGNYTTYRPDLSMSVT